MAMNKVNTAPAFEEQFDDEVATVETVVESEVIEAPTSTEVVAPTKKALIPSGAKFASAYSEFKNSIDTDTVQNIPHGTIPKIVADRGGFEAGDTSYGESLVIELVSFNDRYVITPGVEGEKGKELLAFSFDNVTLANDPTVTVVDYLNTLKNDYDCPKAASRHYLDLWAMVVTSDETGDIPEDDRELVQIQLSPSSVKEWTAMQLQASVKALRSNKPLGNLIKMTVDKREYNGNKFAAIKFSPVSA